MYELKKMERYLRVSLLGLGPRLMKKEFTGRSLTKVEKHWSIQTSATIYDPKGSHSAETCDVSVVRGSSVLQ